MFFLMLYLGGILIFICFLWFRLASCMYSWWDSRCWLINILVLFSGIVNFMCYLLFVLDFVGMLVLVLYIWYLVFSYW